MTRLPLVALLLGCTSTPPAVPPSAVDASMADVVDVAAPTDAADASRDGGPPRLVGRRCDAPAVWSQPLADYLAAGERVAAGRAFLRGVQDLAVFQGRLFVGYGDANINLGRETPIEVRAFSDARPDGVAAEFRTDEEQIEQYRTLGDELWIAGVDATEDAWLGNVYGRVRGAWTKHRTVGNGVHVHDIARWRGALWAVGSGGTPAEWNAGDIYGHLWRSDDDARSFTIAARHHNQGRGDARWIRLLPLRDAMLLFGYRTGAAAGNTTVVNQRWDGTAATALAADDPLRAMFVVETLARRDGGGLVRGAVTTGGRLAHRALRVDPEGRAAEIPALRGRQVLDAWEDPETRELLVLSADEDTWGATPLQYAVRLDVTADLDGFTEVVSFVTDDPTRAVARWRDHIYLGRDDGALLRCALEPPGQ
ncbi:MAG: hypothetical protein U0325_07920 [Polyangiales bacterium]